MPQSRAGQGSAPQGLFDWFSRRGRAEIRVFKTGHQFENLSLPALAPLPSSHFNLRADDLEASQDSRL